MASLNSKTHANRSIHDLDVLILQQLVFSLRGCLTHAVRRHGSTVLASGLQCDGASWVVNEPSTRGMGHGARLLHGWEEEGVQ